ncbi:DUF4148 domain-containing protein [Alcaligenes sp. Marseille-Q7550]
MKVRIMAASMVAALVLPASWVQAAGTDGQDGLTRQQVRAELEQARSRGLIPVTDSDYPILDRSGPEKSREQVERELQQARAQGLLNVADSDYPVVISQGPGKSRDEVLRELEQARVRGLLHHVEP